MPMHWNYTKMSKPIVNFNGISIACGVDVTRLETSRKSRTNNAKILNVVIVLPIQVLVISFFAHFFDTFQAF